MLNRFISLCCILKILAKCSLFTFKKLKFMKHFLHFLLMMAFSLTASAQAIYNVTVTNFSFTPPNLVINQGDIVQWDNVGGFHNVDGSLGSFPGNPEGFTSGAPAGPPWSFSKTFTMTGNYGYLCVVHGAGMSGSITVNGALPIELKYITATVYKGICKVEWKTEKEENLVHFTLQKSTNATDFSDVVDMNANHIPSTYSYMDDMGTDPFVYYRVKITDQNNAIKYTPVRLAYNDIKITKNTLTLLPNPYVEHFHISVQSVNNWTGFIEVYDFSGRVLHKQAYGFKEGNNYVHLENSGSYPKGLYIVAVRNIGNQDIMSATVVKE
jgi:plastocyanin